MRRGTKFVLVFLLAVAAAAGGYSAAFLLYQDAERLQATQDRGTLGAREAELLRLRETLQAERDRRSGERLVDLAAAEAMKRQAAEQEQEIGRLRDQLAFFDQLLPVEPEQALTIRAVQITAAGDALRYRILLMRGGQQQGQAFAGSLQFLAEGDLNGELRTVALSPLKADGEGASDGVGNGDIYFDRYLRTQGLLGLPAGFTPNAVIVNVLEGDLVRTSRQVDLDF